MGPAFICLLLKSLSPSLSANSALRVLCLDHTSVSGLPEISWRRETSDNHLVVGSYPSPVFKECFGNCFRRLMDATHVCPTCYSLDFGLQTLYSECSHFKSSSSWVQILQTRRPRSPAYNSCTKTTYIIFTLHYQLMHLLIKNTFTVHISNHTR